MLSPAQQELSDEDTQRRIGDLLNGYLIGIFCYGLYLMIFGATMRQIAARGEWPAQRVVLALVIFVIWALATACAGMTWRGFYANFVSHGQSQDSVLHYFFYPEAQLLLITIQRSFIALNGVIADLVNIWRCWVLYNRNWRVVVLPALGIVSGIISHAFRTAVLFSNDSYTAMWLASTRWLTVYCSVAASTNILTTSLIIYRILSVSGFRGARTYRGVIEVIIESALLYSVTFIIYLALCIHDYHVPYLSMSSWYAEGFLNAITATAPTLIIWRFAAGEARLNDSWLHTLPHIDTTPAGEIRVVSIHPTWTGPGHDSNESGSMQFALPECEEENTLTPSTFDVDVEKGSERIYY